MGTPESKPAQQEVYQVFQPNPPNPELDRPWRKFDWSQNEALKNKLENFSPSDPNVKEIKILVAGQVGAGKSSFINSIDSVFQGRMSSRALVNTAAGGDSLSFTQKLKEFPIRCGEKTLRFVFKDIMGLEPAVMAGSQPDDIINAVFGHVKDGYKFNVGEALTYKDEQYNHDPALSDQAFCLVYVIPADTVQFTDDRLTDKLKIIRHRISDKGGQDSDTDTALQCQVQTEHVARLLLNYLYDQTMHVGIPQVVVMTKVDEACPLVKNDLRKIYHSKKIKKKMEMCSTKTGVPLTNIFPVKNYHEEIDTDDKIDVLILKAVEQIVQIANDRLLDCETY